jgi:formate dehydrogenase maturation protein FdhE
MVVQDNDGIEGVSMSSKNSVEALESYRTQLGDDLVEFLGSFWTLQESVADDEFIETLQSIITFLDTHHEGFKDATAALFADDFTLEAPKSITADAIDDMVVDLIEVTGVDATGSDAAHLALAVVGALQPKAAKAAEGVEPPAKTSLETGACPVCGSPAALGIMRDEGQAKGGSRELWCALCDYKWGYPRIKCARCGNVRQKELEFFFAEEDPAHRVYACHDCGGTLKVVNEAELGKVVDPRVEEIVLEDLLDALIASGGATAIDDEAATAEGDEVAE